MKKKKTCKPNPERVKKMSEIITRFKKIRVQLETMDQLGEGYGEYKKWVSLHSKLAIEHGIEFNRTNFVLVGIQIDEQGFDGVPYLSTNTFNGWKKKNKHVKKGEKSALFSFSWKDKDKVKQADGSFKIINLPEEKQRPICVALFHASQVKEIEQEEEIKINYTPLDLSKIDYGVKIIERKSIIPELEGYTPAQEQAGQTYFNLF